MLTDTTTSRRLQDDRLPTSRATFRWYGIRSRSPSLVFEGSSGTHDSLNVDQENRPQEDARAQLGYGNDGIMNYNDSYDDSYDDMEQAPALEYSSDDETQRFHATSSRNDSPDFQNTVSSPAPATPGEEDTAQTFRKTPSATPTLVDEGQEPDFGHQLALLFPPTLQEIPNEHQDVPLPAPLTENEEKAEQKREDRLRGIHRGRGSLGGPKGPGYRSDMTNAEVERQLEQLMQEYRQALDLGIESLPPFVYDAPVDAVEEEAAISLPPVNLQPIPVVFHSAADMASSTSTDVTGSLDRPGWADKEGTVRVAVGCRRLDVADYEQPRYYIAEPEGEDTSRVTPAQCMRYTGAVPARAQNLFNAGTLAQENRGSRYTLHVLHGFESRPTDGHSQTSDDLLYGPREREDESRVRE